MKVLVTGCNGMLGYDCVQAFSDMDLQALPKSELDICNEKQVQEVLSAFKPDVLVNCAAFTNVDLCESDRDKAFATNANGPRILARCCRELSCKLVHISTDYVFDGTSTIPYKEDDATGPINVYGESKLAGERAIQNESEDFIIIRTSWLFGRHGTNFIKTILKLANERPELQVVNDQRGCPTFTKDLAEGIRILVLEGARGIFNVTNTGACTWFQLAKFAIRRSGIETSMKPVDSSAFKRPARRPGFSVLSPAKFRRSSGKALRHWQLAVMEYLQDIR